MDLQKELQATRKDKMDNICQIGTLKEDLEIVNKTIQILQNLRTNSELCTLSNYLTVTAQYRHIYDS
jgi:hypothetical protein